MDRVGNNSRDVVGGGLALSLDQDGKVKGVLLVPCIERLKELETVGGGGDCDVDGGALSGRSLVGVCKMVSTSTMMVSSGKSRTHACE